MARLAQPRALIVLLLLMWVPLVIYVMFGNALGCSKHLVLLPGHPRDAAPLRRRGLGLAGVAGSP